MRQEFDSTNWKLDIGIHTQDALNELIGHIEDAYFYMTSIKYKKEEKSLEIVFWRELFKPSTPSRKILFFSRGKVFTIKSCLEFKNVIETRIIPDNRWGNPKSLVVSDIVYNPGKSEVVIDTLYGFKEFVLLVASLDARFYDIEIDSTITTKMRWKLF